MTMASLRIAAIVPCYNEELTVRRVVTDLAAALPEATIYVYDNNSTDRTAEVARESGAIVRSELRPGKGSVVRRAFSDIEADVYVMIDGDDTYDASRAREMVTRLVSEGLDHVVGVRVEEPESGAYRPGHAWGNKVFNSITVALFGEQVEDMFSGYRVFSRRFVKSFPANSEEFEIETELTIHSATLRVPQASIGVGFQDRPEGSDSKLRTIPDGLKILGLISRLLLHERPMFVCSIIAFVSLLASLVLGVPVVIEFFQTGFVDRFPTAFLASSLGVLATLVMSIGVILNGIRLSRGESRRLTYLQFPALIIDGFQPNVADLDDIRTVDSTK